MKYISQRTIAIFFTVLMLFISFSGVVHGATEIGSDFICGGDNTVEEDIGNLVGLFVFGSPVAGSLIYFFTRAGESVGITNGTGKVGKPALRAGITAPIAIYGLEWVVGIAFGINFGCLLPGGG